MLGEALSISMITRRMNTTRCRCPFRETELILVGLGTYGVVIQYGFRCLHSILICLFKNSDDWYNRIDLCKLVGLVYIDLKKAFDSSPKIQLLRGSAMRVPKV